MNVPKITLEICITLREIFAPEIYIYIYISVDIDYKDRRVFGPIIHVNFRALYFFLSLSLVSYRDTFWLAGDIVGDDDDASSFVH